MTAVILILKVIFTAVCIGLVAIILLQKGRAAGLSGVIGGAAETFWSKNKARSMDGGLHKATIGLGAAFIVLALLINILV